MSEPPPFLGAGVGLGGTGARGLPHRLQSCVRGGLGALQWGQLTGVVADSVLSAFFLGFISSHQLENQFLSGFGLLWKISPPHPHDRHRQTTECSHAEGRHH